MTDTETVLYRHFSADGTLLYVGISLSWPARTKAHVRGSRWFNRVAKVEIERHPTREAALDAERQAIKNERPAFNVIHNREPSPQPKRTPRPEPADPLLQAISGPDVIVGPALVYHDNLISVMIAHGEAGTAGELTEVVLGEFIPESPVWADACAVVMRISRANEITIDDARHTRADIISKLRNCRSVVECFDADLSFAVAYAAHFPSKKSRQILNEIAIERGAAT